MNTIRHHNRPPTPSEVVRIRQLVEIQQESMKILRQNETDYEIALQGTKEAISDHKNSLSQAIARHEMTIKLLDALKPSLHTIIDIADPDLDQMIISDQLKKTELGELSRIIETRDTVTQQLQLHIKVLEVSAHSAAEAAAKAEEELQGAYTVETLCLDTLILCRAQINEMQNSLHSKMDRLRAIWRIPEDIWITIFGMLAGHSFDLSSKKEWGEATSLEGPWFQQVRLLGICHYWRNIIQGCPSLWSNPLLVLYTGTVGYEAMFSLYLELSKGRLQSLTLTTLNPFPESPTPIPITLEDMLRKVKSMLSLRCNLTFISGSTIGTWFGEFVLPQVEELYIADFSGTNDSLEIPEHLCGTIRKCVTGALWVSFQSATPLLEEMCVVYPVGGSEFTRLLHELLAQNGKSLRILELRGPSTESASTGLFHDLNNLHEVTITLSTLLIHLGGHYTLPSLRRLNIVTPVEVNHTAWEAFLSTNSISDTIQDISIPSMDRDDIEKLILLLNGFNAIRTFRIYGDSVEPFLLGRTTVLSTHTRDRLHSTKPSLENLEALHVLSYEGTGETILDFIKATKRYRLGNERENDRDSADNTARRVFSVHFTDCLNIVASTRDAIDSELRF
jgi:hypothetical protein